MKKIYMTPSVKSVIINNADIICTSPTRISFSDGPGSNEAESKFINFVGSNDEEEEW